MNKLLEYCKSNGYSLSLTNFLVDLLSKYSTNTTIDEQENFLNALINTKIILVGSIEEFIKTIKDKLYDEIGYKMSSGEELAIRYMYRQKGIYLPIPNVKTNGISRIIIARVSKTNELSCYEDNITLSHELFHLLRSYGNDEIINNGNEVILKSGVISTKIPIKNGVLDYFNGTKENIQCEENFVNFLGEKYSIISQMDIFTVFERLKEIVNCGERFNSLPSNEKNEMLTLYLNLLLVINVYNGNVSSSLNFKNANYLDRIKALYGEEAALLFQNIYSKHAYNESILEQINSVFNTSPHIK